MQYAASDWNRNTLLTAAHLTQERQKYLNGVAMAKILNLSSKLLENTFGQLSSTTKQTLSLFQ